MINPTKTLIMLAAAALLGASACSRNASSRVSTWKWGYDSATYTLTISGAGAMTDYDTLFRPWKVYCEQIKTVVIGDSITSIGNDAFAVCTEMTSATIGSSVTHIGRQAFDGCFKLNSVNIPNSLTRIGSYAFCFCHRITSINISNSVTSIGHYAFAGCNGLTSVTIPNSVVSIGNDAFMGCEWLTQVTLGNSITDIGSYAFANCVGLTSITNLRSTPQDINTNTFNNVDKKTCTLYVPAGSVQEYRKAAEWGEFENIEPIP
jgi:hypothetical protein